MDKDYFFHSFDLELTKDDHGNSNTLIWETLHSSWRICCVLLLIPSLDKCRLPVLLCQPSRRAAAGSQTALPITLHTHNHMDRVRNVKKRQKVKTLHIKIYGNTCNHWIKTQKVGLFHFPEWIGYWVQCFLLLSITFILPELFCVLLGVCPTPYAVLRSVSLCH